MQKPLQKNKDSPTSKIAINLTVVLHWLYFLTPQCSRRHSVHVHFVHINAATSYPTANAVTIVYRKSS